MVTTYTIPTQIQHASINQGLIVYLPGHANYRIGADISDALQWWFTHASDGTLDIDSNGYIGKSGADPDNKNTILFQPGETYYIEYGLNIGLRSSESAVTDSTGTITLWPKVPEFAIKNVIFDLNGATLRQADNTLWSVPQVTLVGDITTGGTVINNAVALHSTGPDGVLSATSTTLTDSKKKYTVNVMTEYTVRIMSGTGVGQSRKIIANTKTTMTINTPWDTIPDATSTFQVEAFIEPAFKPGIAPPTPNNLPWVDFAASTVSGSSVLSNVYPTANPSWIGRHCRGSGTMLDYNSYVDSVDTVANTVTLSGGKATSTKGISKFTLPSYANRPCSSSLAAFNFVADSHKIGDFAGFPILDGWLLNIRGSADTTWATLEVEGAAFAATTTIDTVDVPGNTVTCSAAATTTSTQSLFTIPDTFTTFRADTIVSSNTLTNVTLVTNSAWKGRKFKAAGLVGGQPVFTNTYSYVLEVDVFNNKIRVDQTPHMWTTGINFSAPAVTLATGGAKIGSVTPTTVTYSVGHNTIEATDASLIVSYPAIEPRRRYGVQLIVFGAPGSTAANPTGYSCITKDIVFKNGHLQMGNDNVDDGVQVGVEPWYALAFRACKNVLVQNITSKNAWSDSLNTSSSTDRYDSQVDYMADLVTVDNCAFDGSGRHAMVIAGSIDFVVQNSSFKNTVHWIIDDESFTPARVVGTAILNNNIQCDGYGFMSWGPGLTPGAAPRTIHHTSIANGSTVVNIVSGTDTFITDHVGSRVQGTGVQAFTYVKRWNSYTQIELSQPVTSAMTDGSIVVYDAAVTRDWTFDNNTLTAGVFSMNVSKGGQPGKVDFSGNTTLGSNQITNATLLDRPDGSVYTGPSLVGQKITGPVGVFTYGAPGLTVVAWDSDTNTITTNKNALVTSKQTTPRTVSGLSTSPSSPNLTGPPGSFSVSDVGALVQPTGGASGFNVNTRVKTYTSSSAVVLTNNVSKGQTGISVIIGSDNIFSAQAHRVPWSGFTFTNNKNVGNGRYGGGVNGVTAGTIVPMIGLAESYDDVTVTGNSCGAQLSGAGSPVNYMLGYRVANGGFVAGIPPAATAWTYSNNYWPNAVDNQVAPPNTVSIALTVNTNPGSAAGPQIFTATLTTSDGGSMSGAILFRQTTNIHDTTPALMNSATIVGNVAVFSKPVPLPVGLYYITAYWAGDVTYATATSNKLTYTVGSPPPPVSTTTNLNIVPSTIYNTDNTTFAATITPSDATGRVDFFNDASDTLVGTSTVVAGVAAYILTTPSTGSYSFYAIYQGDPAHLASTSSVQDLTVLDPPPPPPPPVTVWTIDKVKKD